MIKMKNVIYLHTAPELLTYHSSNEKYNPSIYSIRAAHITLPE